jgi:hypothetical protein
MIKSLGIPRRTLLVSALLLGLAGPLAAQDQGASTGAANAPVSDRVVSPEAQAVLDRMTNYLRGLQSFSVESEATRDEVVAFGYKIQNNEHATLVVERPNHIRVDLKGDLRNRSFFYNGKTFVMYSPDDQAYVTTPATDNLDRLIGGLLDAGVEMPLIDVIYQSFAGTLTETVKGGVLVGDSTINGVACDQLAFRQSNVDWQLWVEKGARPVPRKVVITTRYEVGDPQYQSVMTWNVQPKIDKTTFTFTPPKGVEEIPFAEATAVQDGSN